MEGFPVVPKEASGTRSASLLCAPGHVVEAEVSTSRFTTYLIIVMRPSSLAANMDTESFLDGVQHCQILYKQP